MLGACDLFKTSEEETPPAQLPPPTVNDDFIDEDWQLSGNLSDYYYVNGNGDLQQELPQSVFEVQFGESVFITTPVVVDGVGNVLEVSKKISVRGGEEITLTAGSFFAMDAIGYTVDYTIKTLDGKTHSASASVNVLGADTMWVGDGLIIDVSDLALAKQARLVNLNRSISFELTKLLSVEQKAKLEEFSKLGEIVWNIVENGQEKQVLAQTQVPVKEKVTYTVYAQLKADDYVSVVFADVVRFYSSGSVWIDGETIFELPELITEYAPVLVELNGNASYDLTNLLSAEEKTTLANYQAQGDVFWYAIMKNDMKSKSTLISNGVMNFDSMPKANYVVYARSERADGETVFIAKNVDFYDVSDGMVWNEMLSDDERASSDLKLITGANTSTTTVSVADSAQLGKSGVYYQIDVTGDAYAYRLNYSSIHSKEYYEAFRGQEIYLNFEVSLGSATNTTGEEEILGVFGKCLGELNGEDKYRYQYNLGRWEQVKVPLDLILNESNLDTGWENGWENGMLEIENLFFVSGKEARAKDTTFYIGNFRVTQDVAKLASEDKMISLSGASSYDILQLFSEEQQALIESKENVEWVLIPANGGEELIVSSELDFTQIPKGKYSIGAYYAKMAICSINVDFYDLQDPIDWVAEMSASNVLIKDGSPDVSVATNPFGKTGDYYKVVTNGRWFNATFSPIHSKEYYEQFKGLSIELEIDFYLVAQNDETNVVFCGYTGGKQRPANVWLTEKIALDTLLANWDKLFDMSKKGDWSDAIVTDCTSGNFEFYFGGFRMTQNLESLASASVIVDVADKTNFKLVDLFSEEQKALVESKEGVIWKLVPYSGGAEIVSNGSVDFNQVAKERYSVMASYCGLAICSVNVDFYDSNDGVVWNNSVAVDNVMIKSKNTEVSVVTDIFGKTGDFYKITTTASSLRANFNPVHGREYYELFKGTGKKITIEFYLVAPNNETNVVFCGYTGGKQRPANTWITETIELDTLLKYWDVLFDESKNYDWSHAIVTGVTSGSFEFYFGSFTVA